MSSAAFQMELRRTKIVFIFLKNFLLCSTKDHKKYLFADVLTFPRVPFIFTLLVILITAVLEQHFIIQITFHDSLSHFSITKIIHLPPYPVLQPML